MAMPVTVQKSYHSSVTRPLLGFSAAWRNRCKVPRQVWLMRAFGLGFRTRVCRATSARDSVNSPRMVERRRKTVLRRMSWLALMAILLQVLVPVFHEAPRAAADLPFAQLAES